MLGLYPFAPSIFSEPVFHSPFGLIDDDFGWPITTRRYVLPRRRYVHRRSPYDIDTLIDHMAGLTSLDDHELTPTNTESGKSRRRSPRRNASPKLSPRRALNTETEAKTEEKSDVNMASASADSKETEVKTAEPSTAPTAASTAPTIESKTDTTDAASASPASSSSPNTKVATAETAMASAATDNSTNSVSPFRLIKQLNGLNLTVTSSDTAYTITTPVPPSINKSDLQLSVDNNVLTLSAQIKSTQKNAKGTTESSSSVYINRSVRLNRDANTDGIGAHFSDGNLTITVPRIPSEKKQTINIE